ncbi:MAG: Methyltransferase type 11 [Solirubrobacterales bacterium]|nr:Methyltransferase type 11 [Solirubrobacterales bacterium]
MSTVSHDLGEQLRTLITSGLEAPYTSHSGFDGTATGNHYQSVAVGAQATEGFRGDRAGVLDCLDFRGRKVLDLGSNLGEMSRSARTRGARLVDGVEYDPFFVELAQLITAYNGQSRVSFRQGDITDPALYGERYDLVMALSVFHYVSRVIDQLAEITDVLIIETHKLHGNFDGGYLLPVQERFPAMRVLGQTDWGQLGDGSEMRLVILFAKDRERLDDVLGSPQAWARSPSAPAARRTERTIDPALSSTHSAFFEAWDYATAEELLAAVRSTQIPVEAFAANRNVSRHGYSGWAYWLLYLKGWMHYRETGAAGPGNPYFDYMTAHYVPVMTADYVPDGADATIGRELRDPAVAEQVIRRRFADLDRFEAERIDGVAADMAPIRATVGPIAPPSPLKLVERTRGETILARRIDGWHRLFGARLLGVPALRVEIVEEPRSLPPLQGAVEAFAIEEGVVSAAGWCLHPHTALDAIELRRGGETVALAIPHEREDVALAHVGVAHARSTGFALEGKLRDWADEPTRFELLGICDWLPVGRMRIDFEPGMLVTPAPPADLLAHIYGSGDLTRLVLRTALASNALLDAVEPYRQLETFRDAVHWDAGCGLLLPLAARRLLRATLTPLVEDPAARAWVEDAGRAGPPVAISQEAPTELADGAADLVLRDRPLAVLSYDQLVAWLVELRRVLRPGGYAALVTGWAEAERATMLELCGAWLDVVGARTAAAWAGGHVVVLRRP